MFNLKGLLENVIAEAIEDSQESIPTDKLPSALLIAKRIEELESALREVVKQYENVRAAEGYPTAQSESTKRAKEILAQS